MDSLTQVALGAAVGGAVAGRQFGRRAVLWGALCGTLPDLDVFVPLGDAVRDFTYHRAASHSLLVLALLTPLLVWLITKLHPDTREQRKRWALLVYMVFATHVLLDSFTVYGTQIFWPVLTTPMTWSTIFIIDPLYTLPLLVGVIALLIGYRRWPGAFQANKLGLLLSTTYLAWTLGAKLYVEHQARHALVTQGIQADHVLTTPTPFNSLLWRVVAVNAQSYYQGFYSVLDENNDIEFRRHPRSLHLLEPLAHSWAVQRLQWFTKDFYAVTLEGQDVVMSDLRMGVEPSYVFRFKVGEQANPHVREVPVERLIEARDYSLLDGLWDRIWSREARWR